MPDALVAQLDRLLDMLKARNLTPSDVRITFRSPGCETEIGVLLETADADEAPAERLN